MKAHQRIIREKKENEKFENNLFGEYYKEINVDISKSVVMEVNRKTAEKIILEYEWLGTMGTTNLYYGIMFDGVCAGVVCYGYFQALAGYSGYVGEKYGKKGIQLSRGACVFWAHPHSASKLIGKSLQNVSKLGYKYVIAFSDSEAGEIGTVYQATNWHYLGIDPTAGKTNKGHFYLKQNGRKWMDDRDFNKRYGFKNLDKFLIDNPEIKKVVTKPKARYIKLIGNKTENKHMMKYLKDKILPYPKRNKNG